MSLMSNVHVPLISCKCIRESAILAGLQMAVPGARIRSSQRSIPLWLGANKRDRLADGAPDCQHPGSLTPGQVASHCTIKGDSVAL